MKTLAIREKIPKLHLNKNIHVYNIKNICFNLKYPLLLLKKYYFYKKDVKITK